MPLYQSDAGRWVMRYYRDGSKAGARVQETLPEGTTHAEAKRLYRRRLALAGRRGGLTRPTFEQIADAYLEVHLGKLSESWQTRTRQVLDDHLLPFFGNRRVEDLRPFDLERYRAQRLEEVSGSTVNREVTIFNSILSKALASGLITENPIPPRSVERLEEPEGRLVYFERAEWAAFVRAFDDPELWAAHVSKVRRLGPVKVGDGSPEARRYGGGLKPDSKAARAYLGRLHATMPVFRMLLATASRLNEVLSLRWSDVDEKAGVLRVRQGKTGHTKTLPLSKPILEVLKSVRKRSGDALIFQRPNGGAWDDSKVKHAFRLARELAGVREDLTIHSIRHTAASWMAIDGRPALEIQKALGHRSLAMTQRYAHLAPDHLRDALDMLTDRTETHSETRSAPLGRHFGSGKSRRKSR